MNNDEISDKEGVIFVLLFFGVLFAIGYTPVVIEWFQVGRFQ